ncbi:MULTISPECIES: PIG-L family deacetylase [Nonomuraea]|uniref:PIG-L family deacetylase n=1 Tax=Nonomuraea ferruginea TaxID=46174 RepID=A0ABT4SUQ5_9ACTN|nr:MULTISPECIES: PIG-L family deacetylase [Nonomuraea]MDA0640698.1 PIG-L family deacetylase [Nonomuraea ferruginea]TXK41338.1 GlcNAc-PI de-N-acetylase [Nonomuraea sp. C10]
MESRLTLMAVHAHPDDECLSTGGVLARYAAEGVRTVLVTCTNGEQGDGPGGVKPGEAGHDAAEVAERRLAELRASADHLGIEHVELLGYRDSGMAGWSTNDHPDAFANVSVESAAARLTELMARYRPQVVVTYDETGGSGYGHPDHVQAHRVAVAAVNGGGVPDKLYYTAIPRAAIANMAATLRESGIDLGFEPDDDFGTPDELVNAIVDVSAYVDRKLKALEAHASQGENIFPLRMPPQAQQQMFSHEAFTRVQSRVKTPAHEDDLFTGLR